MKLPKSQSRMGGRITHSSCMQVSVPFDSLELSWITSLQHQSCTTGSDFSTFMSALKQSEMHPFKISEMS